MEVPIVIAARNESKNIGLTLNTLANQSLKVQPVVIVNGCTDKTADIALEYGAKVLESEEGKIPALQSGFRFLGKRAIEPVLILDADTRPMSRHWNARMTSELLTLPSKAPSMVWGLYLFQGEINPVLGTLFSLTSMYVSWTDRQKNTPRTIRGGNTGLLLRNKEVLEEFLALDNYWPRDDVAIFDILKKHGANHKVVFNSEARVITSGYRTADTLRRMLISHKHPSKVMDESYEADAPLGSKPYYSATTDTVQHEKPLF